MSHDERLTNNTQKLQRGYQKYKIDHLKEVTPSTLFDRLSTDVHILIEVKVPDIAAIYDLSLLKCFLKGLMPSYIHSSLDQLLLLTFESR